MCAVAIDACPAAKHWVRNVDPMPWSYWLLTSTDRLYPDFVADLEIQAVSFAYLDRGVRSRHSSRATA